MPIDMPTTPGFTDAEFYLETNTQVFRSPLDKSTQRIKLGGDRWMATFSLPRMHRAQAAAWKAFFLLCDGRVNTFNAYDPDNKTPRGSWAGTPLVKGGSQTGSTLLIDGLTPNTAKAGRMGDYFNVNGELHQLTSDFDSDGSGEATISFKPAMRSSPADNAPLTTDRPTCTMILVDDQQGRWPCDKNGIYAEKTFSAEEVF